VFVTDCLAGRARPAFLQSGMRMSIRFRLHQRKPFADPSAQIRRTRRNCFARGANKSYAAFRSCLLAAVTTTSTASRGYRPEYGVCAPRSSCQRRSRAHLPPRSCVRIDYPESRHSGWGGDPLPPAPVPATCHGSAAKLRCGVRTRNSDKRCAKAEGHEEAVSRHPHWRTA
jgi:hypothetical protein